MSTRAYPADAVRLANFISSLHGFTVYKRTGAEYDHMGAVIVDTVLQAGLNYSTVVSPRVQKLMRRWPSASLTSTFLTMIRRYGLKDVLNWRDDEKPRRIVALTEFFFDEQVDTEEDCRAWLADDGNLPSLEQIRGVGPKSIDYLKSLVGMPAVAVDRHVRTFVAWAGLSATQYADIRWLVCEAADLLGYGHSDLDHAIWQYVSASSTNSGPSLLAA